MRVEIAIAGLHDVVIREPFYGRIGVLVDRCRVQSDGLVVCDVAPALAFAGEQFRVEAPGDDGVDDDFVGVVDVVFFGDGEELAVAAARPCAAIYLD